MLKNSKKIKITVIITKIRGFYTKQKFICETPQLNNKSRWHKNHTKTDTFLDFPKNIVRKFPQQIQAHWGNLTHRKKTKPNEWALESWNDEWLKSYAARWIVFKTDSNDNKVMIQWDQK